jgi:hypothetical protein
MFGKKVVNGVNLVQLSGAMDLFREYADSAKSKFRAKNKWAQGTHTRAAVNGFCRDQ